MTEKQFEAAVRKEFLRFGYAYYHTHRSQFSPSGFPDSLGIKGNRLIVAELKVGKNKVTPAQQAWLEAFSRVEGCEAYVWNPDDPAFDWLEVARILMGREDG